jgi:hypothetical protein
MTSPNADHVEQRVAAVTCAGCGQHFASGDAIAATITFNYAEFCVTDDYCFECRYEINKAIRRLHKREAASPIGRSGADR